MKSLRIFLFLLFFLRGFMLGNKKVGAWLLLLLLLLAGFFFRSQLLKGTGFGNLGINYCSGIRWWGRYFYFFAETGRVRVGIMRLKWLYLWFPVGHLVTAIFSTFWAQLDRW